MNACKQASIQVSESAVILPEWDKPVAVDAYSLASILARCSVIATMSRSGLDGVELVAPEMRASSAAAAAAVAIPAIRTHHGLRCPICCKFYKSRRGKTKLACSSSCEMVQPLTVVVQPYMDLHVDAVVKHTDCHDATVCC
jgi:hypothetical protein